MKAGSGGAAALVPAVSLRSASSYNLRPLTGSKFKGRRQPVVSLRSTTGYNLRRLAGSKARTGEDPVVSAATSWLLSSDTACKPGTIARE